MYSSPRRLLDDPAYAGRVFADTSATVFVNHSLDALRELVVSEELHPALVHGSDYPLVGVNCVVWLDGLADAGLLTSAEAEALGEVCRYNPLLFGFVLQRSLRDAETGARLGPEVFAVPRPLREAVAAWDEAAAAAGDEAAGLAGGEAGR